MLVFVYRRQLMFQDYLLGQIVNVEKRGEVYYLDNDTGYIKRNCFLTLDQLEEFKIDYPVIKTKELVDKYDIKILWIYKIRDYLSLSKIKKEKPIKIPRPPKKIKEKKPKIFPFIEIIDINEFKKDFANELLTSSDLVSKYKVCYGTIWITSKQLGLKKRLTSTSNRKHMNILVNNTKEVSKEDLNFIKQYCDNPYLTKKWLCGKIDYKESSTKVKIKEMGLIPVKRLTRGEKISRSQVNNMRRDLITFSDSEFLHKYEYSAKRISRQYSLFRPSKTLRKKISLYRKGYICCTKCNQTKEIHNFHKADEKLFIKYRSDCKDCRKIEGWKRSGVKGNVSAGELSAMKDYFNNSCAYCGEIITPDIYTLDHVIPRIDGGTNNINNIVIACIRCNTAKCMNNVEDFYNKKDYFTRDNYEKVVEYTSDVGFLDRV